MASTLSMMYNAHAPYLFTTDYGRVLHCACCGRVQIEFDDLLLLLNGSDVEQLAASACWGGAPDAGSAAGRPTRDGRLLISVGRSCCGLLMSQGRYRTRPRILS
jgi:hypothetical protein